MAASPLIRKDMQDIDGAVMIFLTHQNVVYGTGVALEVLAQEFKVAPPVRVGVRRPERSSRLAVSKHFGSRSIFAQSSHG